MVTTCRPRKRPAIVFHHVRSLDPRDIVLRNGVPVTTVPRTLVDLSDVLTKFQLANVVHEAAFRRLFNLEATRSAMARANGRHHLDVLDRAIDLHLSGSAGTKSDLEDTFLALLARGAVAEPLVNTHLLNEEVDFHWPDSRLVVEVDGHGHNRPPTKEHDIRRDAKLTEAGWKVLRFSGDDIELRTPRRSRPPAGRLGSGAVLALDAHPHARAVLGAALKGDPAHAYLLHGPAGSGKRDVARAFAGELLATRRQGPRQRPHACSARRPSRSDLGHALGRARDAQARCR